MIPALMRPGRPALALLLSMLFLVTACGSLPLFATDGPSRPGGSPVPGSAAPTPNPAPSQMPPTGDPEAGLFVPPDPLCPAPSAAVAAPRLIASVRGASVVMTVGSSSVTTCTTAGSTDVVAAKPTKPLRVVAGDAIRLTLTPGWRFLYWQDWGVTAATAGANVTPEGEMPEQPAVIDIPIPGKSGLSVVGVSVWAISADGGAVSGIEGTVLVQR